MSVLRKPPVLSAFATPVQKGEAAARFVGPALQPIARKRAYGLSLPPRQGTPSPTTSPSPAPSLKPRPGVMRVLLIALFCAVSGVSTITAQEPAGPEFNIDSLFDLPPESPETDEAQADTSSTEEDSFDLLQRVILSRGFSIEADYKMGGLFAPGLSEAPWADKREDAKFSTVPGLQMSAYLALDIQLSEALRVQPFRFFLSEILSEEYEDDRLNIYREDFVDSFQKMAADWMATYLPQKSEAEKNSPN